MIDRLLTYKIALLLTIACPIKGNKTAATQVIGMAFYKFDGVNSLNSYDMLLQMEEQNYQVEIKKSITCIFLNSSLEAIVHLVQKVLLTYKIKQKITLVALQNLWKWAKMRPE